MRDQAASARVSVGSLRRSGTLAIGLGEDLFEVVSLAGLDLGLAAGEEPQDLELALSAGVAFRAQ